MKVVHLDLAVSDSMFREFLILSHNDEEVSKAVMGFNTVEDAFDDFVAYEVQTALKAKNFNNYLVTVSK